MKRGGGRRLTGPSDVELLRGMRDLLQNEGYTIRGVQKILREDGVDAVKAASKGTFSRPAALRGCDEPARWPSGRRTSLSATDVRSLRAMIAELDACRHPARRRQPQLGRRRARNDRDARPTRLTRAASPRRSAPRRDIAMTEIWLDRS